MKRLFKVVNHNNKQPVKSNNGDVIYFESKQEAKQVRNDRSDKNLIVSRGPDHWKEIENVKN